MFFYQGTHDPIGPCLQFNIISLDRRVIIMSDLQKKHISDIFLRGAARPLQLFLLATGVPLMVTSPTVTTISNNKWSLAKKILFGLWSAFWLMLNIQSGIYTFVRRAINISFQALSRVDKLSGSELTENFTTALFSSTSFLVETSTHFMLVLTIRSTLTRFCFALEPIDRLLGSPSLTGVRRGSLAALAFIFYTVYQIINTL